MIIALKKAFLNTDLIKKVEVPSFLDSGSVYVYFNDGTSNTFKGEDAQTIISAFKRLADFDNELFFSGETQ